MRHRLQQPIVGQKSFATESVEVPLAYDIENARARAPRRNSMQIADQILVRWLHLSISVGFATTPRL